MSTRGRGKILKQSPKENIQGEVLSVAFYLVTAAGLELRRQTRKSVDVPDRPSRLELALVMV